MNFTFPNIVDWFKSLISAVNSIEQHVWAVTLILVGALLYKIGQPAAGLSLTSGGMAIFQKPDNTTPQQ